MSRPLREIALAGAVVLLALVTFFPGLVFLHQAVFAQDTWAMQIPAKVYLATRIRHGAFPFWYPYDGLGVPFVQSTVLGTFHPFTLLYLWLRPFTALTISLLCLVALAIGATFLLARRLGAGLAGATVSALAFGLGGPFISSLVQVQFAAGIAGFPLLLLGIERLARGPRRDLGALLVTLAVAQAVLIGDLEAAYLYGLFGLPVLLVLRPRAGAVRAAAALGAAGAAGLCLAAIQLLPSLSVLAVVPRNHAIPWVAAARWSVSPLRLPGIVLGDLLRFQATGQVRNLTPLFGVTGSPWIFSMALGVIVGLGVIWALGLGAAPRGLRVALGLVAMLGLWLALGRYGGLYRVLYALLPGFDRFRYPAKILAYGTLGVALLGGLGIEAALAAPRRAARLALVTAGTFAGIAGGVALARARLGLPVEPGLPRYLSRLAWAGLRDAAIVAGVGAALWIASRRARGARLAGFLGAGLVLLQLGDLVGANGPVLRMISGDTSVLMSPSPFARTLARTAGPGLGHYRVANLLDQMRLPRIPGAGNSYLAYAVWKRLVMAPDLPALDGICSVEAYLPATTARLRRLMDGRMAAFVSRDAPLLGTPFLVTTRRLAARFHLGGERVLARLPGSGLVLTRYPPPLVRPRAFVAPPLFVSGADAAARALARQDVRAGRVAVLEQRPAPAAPAGTAPGTAHIDAYAPEAVRIAVTVPPDGAQVLVLNDAWYPGWRATLDGRPVPIRPANLAVRGVLVPPGHHEVIFRYPIPVALEAGAGLSVLAALGLLVATVVRGRRRERDPGSREAT